VRPRRIWDLGLDAEEEMAGRSPRAAAREGLRRNVLVLADRLPPDEAFLGELPHPRAWPGQVPAETIGDAWCPTPKALARLRAAGASPAPAPAPAVLRRVLDRRFGVVFAPDRWVLESGPLPPGRWRVKPPFSCAGRGQRTVEGPASVARLLARHGALVVEPEVDVLEEAATWGWIGVDGAIGLLAPRLQEVRRGVWQRSRPLRPSDRLADHRATLVAAARRVGESLAEAGFFGPFGVDALLHAGGLRAVSEINPRWTMGSFGVYLPPGR
jgi:hypothetical protein